MSRLLSEMSHDPPPLSAAESRCPRPRQCDLGLSDSLLELTSRTTRVDVLSTVLNPSPPRVIRPESDSIKGITQPEAISFGGTANSRITVPIRR